MITASFEDEDLLEGEGLLAPHARAARRWGRSHFLAVAAMVMRSVLVDHARARQRAKRGGNARALSLGAADGVAAAEEPVDVVALDDALNRLAAQDARKARVVELRYFVGLSIEETAKALDSSPATVKREWTTARAWLRRELSTA